MSKKIYKLEIKFDSETDEVDYVLETCNKSGIDSDSVTCTWDYLELSKHFDEETMKLFDEYVINYYEEDFPEA